MKVLYFTVDGRVVHENSNVNARFIEMRDGYHPITNDSIWQDTRRLRPPILAMFEGVLGPQGSSMAEQDVKGLLLEVEIIKRAHRKPSISKMWLRALMRIVEWIYSKGILLFITLFAGYFILQAMIGGNF
jgi:hypothetical protein